MEIRVDLPSDVDIFAFLATVPGAEVGKGWVRDKGAWFIEAPNATAVAAAALRFDVAGDRLRRAKTTKLVLLAERRWRAETAGTIALDKRISTSRESQALVAGTMLAKKRTLDFKTLDGWIVINAAQLMILQDAVSDHVQKCFSRERELAVAVDAATDLAALDAVDIEVGWP